MKLFQITVNAGEEAAKERLDAHYSDHYCKIAPGAWIVAAKGGTTTGDLAGRILNSDKSEKGEPSPGLVIRIEAYNGWYSSDLWERMKAWAEA